MLEELLKQLKISSRGDYSQDGNYVIDISNSDAWGAFYQRLENADLLDSDEESSILTEDEASLIYTNDDFMFTLLADFKENIYKLVIKEL